MKKNFGRAAYWCAVMVFSGLSLAPVQAAPVQQLYLVRHAQKADNSKDPTLSVCGQAQAAALATLLGDVDLPLLYHSGFQRTQQTAAASLKEGRRLKPYNAGDLARVAAEIVANGHNALIVGHSNTTPQLVTLLSQLSAPAIAENEYGRIYQLSFVGGEWALQLLQLPQPAVCKD